MGTEGLFPKGKTDGAVKLMADLHLVPRSRIVELYSTFSYIHGVELN
jgi:hypothetical protein